MTEVSQAVREARELFGPDVTVRETEALARQSASAEGKKPRAGAAAVKVA